MATTSSGLVEAAAAKMNRPRNIEALMETSDQFKETAIPIFETYATQQVAEASYDFAANKQLVKLYQFYPSKCRTEVLAVVLTKAMMARPAPDFKALLYVCPEALVEQSSMVKRVAKCEALLEASDLAAFWTEARKTDEGPSVESLVPGLPAAVRRFVLHLVAATYQEAPLTFFAEALGLSVDDARALAQAPPAGAPIAGVAGDLVKFVLGDENQARQPTVSKSLQLKTLLDLNEPKIDIFRPLVSN